MNPAITVRNLNVRYGQSSALRDVSFSVFSGQRLFIAGANGAGKSSLLRVLAGAVKPCGGDIRIHGRDTRGQSPDRIVRSGYTMVPEGREVFQTLTVEENLLTGAYLVPSKQQIDDDLDFVFQLFPVLRERRATRAGVLSGGQQQMLAVGRALMTRSPIVALDEPTLGLASRLIDEMYTALIDLQERRGLTLLMAEQSYAGAIALDADLLVLRAGRIALSGQARALARTGELERAYFGF